MSKVKELTDNNFDTEVLNSDKPVVIDFFAPWCGHCKVQEPILDSFAEEIGDKAVVAKINVDENLKKATEFGISGIPSFVVFQNGKMIKQEAGVHQKADLSKMISSLLN